MSEPRWKQIQSYRRKFDEFKQLVEEMDQDGIDFEFKELMSASGLSKSVCWTKLKRMGYKVYKGRVIHYRDEETTVSSLIFVHSLPLLSA